MRGAKDWHMPFQTVPPKLIKGGHEIDWDHLYMGAVNPVMDTTGFDEEWYEKTFPFKDSIDGLMERAKEGDEEAIDKLKSEHNLKKWIYKGRRII